MDSKKVESLIFHQNPTENWFNNIHLCDTYGGQNPNCSVKSMSCSKDMSDISDLCLWHRLRMAHHFKESCGCKINDVCSGDAVARQVFRNYYKQPKLPVMDLSGRLYCCGYCQNTDSETHECGIMLVGKCCIDLHKNAISIDNYEDGDNDNSSNYEDDNGNDNN